MARSTKRDAEKPDNSKRADAPNAVWFKPVMFGFMLFGLVWILVYYVSQASWPVPSFGPWNIMVGFGIMFIGFLMTTRWR